MAEEEDDDDAERDLGQNNFATSKVDGRVDRCSSRRTEKQNELSICKTDFNGKNLVRSRNTTLDLSKS